jgi:hypothetical protein
MAMIIKNMRIVKGIQTEWSIARLLARQTASFMIR